MKRLFVLIITVFLFCSCSELTMYGTTSGTMSGVPDIVPDGMPAPVEPQDAVIDDSEHSCTISIVCDSLLDPSGVTDKLDKEKRELVPSDGVILAPAEVTFYGGESVFNLLRRVCRQNAIHLEFTETPLYNSAYIEGIANLYEFDAGEFSGWIYTVNGWQPSYGSSRYALSDGDVIIWRYSLDIGSGQFGETTK